MENKVIRTPSDHLKAIAHQLKTGVELSPDALADTLDRLAEMIEGEVK